LWSTKFATGSSSREVPKLLIKKGVGKTARRTPGRPRGDAALEAVVIISICSGRVVRHAFDLAHHILQGPAFISGESINGRKLPQRLEQDTLLGDRFLQGFAVAASGWSRRVSCSG
jgi:hypothetical protein